jgi:hypothetical protein
MALGRVEGLPCHQPSARRPLEFVEFELASFPTASGFNVEANSGNRLHIGSFESWEPKQHPLSMALTCRWRSRSQLVKDAAVF